MNLTEKQQALYDRGLTLFKDLTDQKRQAILNKIKITYDAELVEYTDEMILALLNDAVFSVFDNNLYTKYIMPPFSVLNTQAGEWQKRRKIIDGFIGSSLVGRPEGLVYGDINMRPSFDRLGKTKQIGNGTSQFDSVLCELLLKWFGFKGCKVFDPFAGGHIRGAMASLAGYSYTGTDLNPDQIAANKAQGDVLLLNPMPNWINDDALNLDKYVAPASQDLIFTCPPYGDLEQYTTDTRDLSNMDYAAFRKAHWTVIKKSLEALKNDRFAVWVVGDFRDEKGFYRGFVADTIKAFKYFGVELYNEAILLNSVGTASMRASGMFTNRKLAKIHQNVLVFYKGDPKTIQANYGQVDSSLPVKDTVQAALF